jgi:DNA-binding LacI/PurR family transcriptional regulator
MKEDGRPITARDLAQHLNVSQSAVSRAFTPGSRIAAETRELILKTARELGYRPNRIASSLTTKSSRIIGLAVSYLENQFYPVVIDRLSQKLQAKGFHVLLFTVDKQGQADPLIEDVLQYRVDALVLTSTMMSSKLAAQCKQNGVPVILFNRTTEAPDISSVTGENLVGGAAIAEYLTVCGYSRLGFIAGLEDSSTSRTRERAFKGWLIDYGYSAPVRAVGDYDYEKAGQAAKVMMTSASPPEAIFCANDHTAIAAMDTIRYSLGLRVPEDVAIVGFDDVPAARWPSYGLTTFSQPVDAMVEAVTDMIEGGISVEGTEPSHVKVKGELIIRKSSPRPNLAKVGGELPRNWRIEGEPA